METERDIIYFSKRQGTIDDPFVDITEELYVQYGKVFLKELPVKAFKVTVQNANNSYMTEVYTNDELATTNTYFVDYANGVVFFNGFNNSLLKTLTYKGEGVILFPASRIYTNSNDGSSQVDTLQNVVSLAQNIQPVGTFSTGVTYKKGNIVFKDNVSYMALQDSIGITPPNTSYWQVVLQGGLRGEKGEQGIQGLKGDKGDTGNTGTTLFTWVKYANTPTSGISDDPTGKEYIGIATNKTTPTKSNFYTDYTWSLIKGERGLKGDKGDQGLAGTAGTSLFTWVKYGDTPTTGMSDSPVGKAYIGIAVNKSSAVKSTAYADYTWSLIKGEQGIQGVQGLQGEKGDTGNSGSVITTWKGTFSSGTEYAAGDLARYEGRVYIAKVGTVGNLPTNATFWEIFVEKGTDGAGSVTSVNTKTGVITLTNADVGAPSTAEFTGHTGDSVKHITAQERTEWNAKATGEKATPLADGLMPKEDKAKLDGVASNANNYSHPVNHPPSIILQDASNRFVTDSEKNTWSNKASKDVATPLADGLMPMEDKEKLDGIQQGANNYSHPATHPPSIIQQDVSNRFVTDAEKTTWNNKISSTEKGVANGVARLNANGNVVNANGTEITSTGTGGTGGAVSSVNGETGAVVLNSDDTFSIRVINVKEYGALGNGSADDSVPIQNAINAAYSRTGGGTLYFPAGTYLISTPLIVPDTWSEDKEVNWLGDGARVSRIRPMNSMECLLYLKGWGGYMKNIEFNGRIPATGTNAAKYAVKANDVKEKVISGCNFNYANIHGFYLQGNEEIGGSVTDGNNNLMVFDQSCKFDQNGTRHTRTDASGTTNTITFSSWNPLTANVYIGAFVKIGSGKGSVYHIDSVTANSVTVSPNLKAPLTAGTVTYIHMGDGLHLERGADNNVFGIYDCHFVGNWAVGCTSRGLYGQNFQGGNVDYNGIAGLLIGSGMVSVTPSYSNTVYHGYFENNGYANIILDYPNGLDITEPILAAPIDGVGEGLESITSLRGYYFDYGYTSVTLGGNVYQYFYNEGNVAVVDLDTGLEHTVIRRSSDVSTPTIINLPEPPTHDFGETYEIYMDDSGGQQVHIKCAFTKVNRTAGSTGVFIPAGVGYRISVYYSRGESAWMVSHTLGVGMAGTGGGGALTIEQRTSDPTNPSVGQIWLRTDL